MEEEFGLTGQASVMIEDVDPVKVFVYKDKINSMPYIMEVIWIDNFIERDVIQNIQDLLMNMILTETFVLVQFQA